MSLVLGSTAILKIGTDTLFELSENMVTPITMKIKTFPLSAGGQVVIHSV